MDRKTAKGILQFYATYGIPMHPERAKELEQYIRIQENAYETIKFIEEKWPHSKEKLYALTKLHEIIKSVSDKLVEVDKE